MRLGAGDGHEEQAAQFLLFASGGLAGEEGVGHVIAAAGLAFLFPVGGVAAGEEHMGELRRRHFRQQGNPQTPVGKRRVRARA